MTSRPRPTLLKSLLWLAPIALQFLVPALLWAAGGGGHGAHDGPAFPMPLDAYTDDASLGLIDRLMSRIDQNPFNAIATGIFLLAIIHTFFAGSIMDLSHKVQHDYIQNRVDQGIAGSGNDDVSFWGQMLHFLGEVEAIFGIWVLVLMGAITAYFGWDTTNHYIAHKVNFIEPMFVVVILAMAATRPILNFAENTLRMVAKIGHGSPAAWWITILVIAPLLGSFITEPAAMTIAALLLGKQFYSLKPSVTMRHATLGLLFVNVSVGGTLTNFAAPPVLMVAAAWDWSTPFMLEHFGWKAALGIVVATALYYIVFQKEFKVLAAAREEHKAQGGEVTSDDQTNLVPFWITLVHMGFLLFTVVNAHYPVLFIGGFMFFLGFMAMTPQHQNKLEIKTALLVGFFLAGLVIHGGLQGWWISPVLKSLTELPLMIVATVLTAFNDNAAITYLSSLVPGFSDSLKYAVMAGAVTGGGLTVIANAPNPAGQSILSKFFPNKSVNPLLLAAYAMPATIIMGLAFYLL